MIEILITGGNGYLGNNFLKGAVSDNNINITSVIRRKSNFPKTENLKEVFADINDVHLYENELLNSEYIIWFATLRTHFAPQNKIYQNNIKPIKQVLEVLKSSKVLKKFIFISSISAIDNVAFSDTPISDSIIPNPKTPYGKSKLVVEQLIEQSNIPFLILRLPFMYGSGFKPYTHLWLWYKIANFPLVDLSVSEGQLSLLHHKDLTSILLNEIKTNNTANNQKLLISDKNIYKIDDIIQLLKPQKKRHLFKLNISPLGRIINNISLSRSTKYWSRILFDKNVFSVIPSSHELLNNYSFMKLNNGLKETYKNCAQQAVWQKSGVQD